MEPRIENIEPKKLVGIRMEMSLSNNKTGELWQTFMPRRNEIKNRKTGDYISMQHYGDFSNFSPVTVFNKWAAVEVSSTEEVPAGMKTHLLKGGLYAVFDHHGPASTAAVIMQKIFGEWFPNSDYEVDNREHFEILPENYNPIDPNAREEIWIPVRSENA